MAANRREPPEVCPVCGEDVPRNASACRECGADYDSGWNEDSAIYDGLDLPEEEFDYDKFVREEFESSLKPSGIKTVWWITAIVLVVAMVLSYCYFAF